MSIASEITRIKNAVHGDPSKAEGDKGSVKRSLNGTAQKWGVTSSSQNIDTLAELLANISVYAPTTNSTAYTITGQNSAWKIPAGYHNGKESVKASFPTTSASKTSLNCGETSTIKKGYLSSDVTITANSLASQTGVDSGKTAAASGQILSGYQAWVNGNKVSGAITKNGNGTTTTLSSTKTSVNIDPGYWSSANKVQVETMEAPTVTISGNAGTIQCKDKLMLGNIDIPAANICYAGSSIPDAADYGEGDLFLVI